MDIQKIVIKDWVRSRKALLDNYHGFLKSMGFEGNAAKLLKQRIIREFRAEFEEILKGSDVAIWRLINREYKSL